MKTILKRSPIILLPAVLISGCATWGPDNSASNRIMDINERNVLSTEIVESVNELDSDGKLVGKSDRTRRIYCAEPSPDGMSALSLSIAAEGNYKDKANIAGAISAQEQAAFVGLRTQSIQLLRDSMYRLCEAHMAGAMDRVEYSVLARRYQKYMVGLLAIEQLTGAVKAPQVAITSKGLAEAGRSLKEMQALKDSFNKELTEKKEALAKLESPEDGSAEDAAADQGENSNETGDASESNSTDAVQNNDTNAEKGKMANALKAEIKDLESNIAAIDKGISNARGYLASGEGAAQFSLVGMPTQRSDAHVLAVADAVKEITMSIVNSDDFSMLCVSQAKTGTMPEAFKALCEPRLNETVQNLAARRELMAVLSKRILETEDLSKFLPPIVTNPDPVKTYDFPGGTISNLNDLQEWINHYNQTVPGVKAISPFGEI